MSHRRPHEVSILLGIPAAVLAVILNGAAGSTVTAALLTAVVFTLFGVTAGAITGRVRSGLAMAVPIVLFVLLSVAFAGQIDSFLKTDTPILGVALAGGLIGSGVGAGWRKRRSRAA